MDGSPSTGGNGFDKAADVFQAATHSMKTAFPSAIQSVGVPSDATQGMIPEQQAGPSGSVGAQQIDMIQPGLLQDDPGKTLEEEKLKKAQEEIRQKKHKQNYFYPVFEAKPKQIEREREEAYKAKNEQVVEEKKQEEFTKTQQSDDIFSRQQRVRREGEGMKVGG